MNQFFNRNGNLLQYGFKNGRSPRQIVLQNGLGMVQCENLKAIFLDEFKHDESFSARLSLFKNQSSASLRAWWQMRILALACLQR